MLLNLLGYFRRRAEKRTIFRNFIFGVEDSLVSTVGLLSGVASAAASRETIVTSGIVLIFVEAFSMGIGSYISEETTTTRAGSSLAARAAFIMFISYFAAGFVPLSPYLLVDVTLAYPLSIGFSLIALTVLGIYSAHRFGTSVIKKSIEMLVLGGLATLVGVGIGSLFRTL